MEIYEKFDFSGFFKENLIGSGMHYLTVGVGIANEHLIPVSLDLKHDNIYVKDYFEYDILNFELR